MPRSRLPRLTSITDGSFEPSKRNPISLRNDEPLDSHLKQLKVGEHTTPLELSEEELRVNGDIFINGKFKSNKIETVGGKYLDLIGSYIRMYTPSVDAGKETEFAFATNGALVIDVKDSFNVDSDTDMTLTANEDDFHFYGGGSNAVDLYFRFDSNNYCLLNVADSGVTTLSTVDSDGTVGHLTIQPDGDLVLDPVSQKILINATDALYFDGGTHTSIRESSDDTLSFVVGGTNLVDMIEASTNQVNINSSELSIDAAKKLFFDGGGLGDTYITESSADVLDVKVGGDMIFQITESGADGNTIDIDNACIGFTQLEPTYDASNTVVDFRLSNKQNLTFGSGSITNVQLRFPLVSGNFQLLIKQDGTGSRTITNYKVYEFDESSADGSAAVVFAGGSNPTLTTDANHVDILSFYWDADNEIAYGVATLDFQF